MNLFQFSDDPDGRTGMIGCVSEHVTNHLNSQHNKNRLMLKVETTAYLLD